MKTDLNHGILIQKIGLQMICCIGLFAGFLLGQYLGVGPILAPVGFIAGLAGDMTIFGLLGKRGGKKTRRIAQSCCLPSSPKTETRGKNDVLLHTQSKSDKEEKEEKR